MVAPRQQTTKRMLVLRKQGLIQREIAEKLTVIFGKNYIHQGVSRSLAAVSKAFRLGDDGKLKFLALSRASLFFASE